MSASGSNARRALCFSLEGSEKFPASRWGTSGKEWQQVGGPVRCCEGQPVKGRGRGVPCSEAHGAETGTSGGWRGSPDDFHVSEVMEYMEVGDLRRTLFLSQCVSLVLQGLSKEMCSNDACSSLSPLIWRRPPGTVPPPLQAGYMSGG